MGGELNSIGPWHTQYGSMFFEDNSFFLDEDIAILVGIKVLVVEEKYTSGTSYIDGEEPIKSNYNKSRRKHRGLFISNSGIRINADVNGSYQMMKKANYTIPYKGFEKVTVLKVA